MGAQDFFKLIQPEILDSALTDSCMMKAQIFIFEELNERTHFVFVIFGGGFLSFEFLLFSLDVFLLGGFGLFGGHFE